MKIAVIGGDKRQILLCDELEKKYDNVVHIISSSNLREELSGADVVIFPIPTTRDRVTVNCSLSDDKIPLYEIENLLGDSLVITSGCKFKAKNVVDLNSNEAFLLKNAAITAEGAIEYAMQNTELALLDSNCLVVGNGRIGKMLALRLKCMCAGVTVSARKSVDFAMLQSLGINSINTGNIKEHISDYDIIFNTVDSTVIGKAEIENSKKNALFMELASAPYGINKQYIDSCNRKYVLAAGMPAKVAPISAAKVLYCAVCDTIDNNL